MVAHLFQHESPFAFPPILGIHASAQVPVRDRSRVFLQFQLTFLITLPPNSCTRNTSRFPPILRIHSSAPSPARETIRISSKSSSRSSICMSVHHLQREEQFSYLSKSNYSSSPRRTGPNGRYTWRFPPTHLPAHQFQPEKQIAFPSKSVTQYIGISAG